MKVYILQSSKNGVPFTIAIAASEGSAEELVNLYLKNLEELKNKYTTGQTSYFTSEACRLHSSEWTEEMNDWYDWLYSVRPQEYSTEVICKWVELDKFLLSAKFGNLE